MGKGRPYRTVWLDGYEILVGRGDDENDRLTFEVAAPDDVWMHVVGTPGSHVIVRNPEGLASLPARVVERAAQLAAWYSKSRNARRVEVHVCHARDVSKPPGWAPGKVLLRQWTPLRVRPERFDSDEPADV
jgi:predicted ribosome quality control (RQC) complex YloA/Tae2 family protein